MKRNRVLVAAVVFLSSMSFAEAGGSRQDDSLDQVPSMSGKIEIMEELGLIEHPSPFQQISPRKTSNSKKAVRQKVRMGHLADISVDGEH
ncbi:MAG TPA: hypothetical protein VIG33_13170 [Pseudobdellovibrionaceae bacterium]|jgi:hypothetical protein